MSEQLAFDRLFDKLDSLGEDIGDLKESHVEIKTQISYINDTLADNKETDKRQDEELKKCHERHDKIEGALKFGGWILAGLGLTGVFKMAKEMLA